MENNFQFKSAFVSDRGLSEKRPQNEDSYLVLDQKGVYAVADGVGGAQAGDVASQMAMEILGEAFYNFAENVDPEEILRAAIERANQAVYQMASDLPQLASMATTIAAVHISGNIATIAHVGDSRVYRIDPEGYLTRETDDHSVVEEEVRAGRMTSEQAVNHPSRNVISRAVGAEATVDIDVRTIMIDPGTIFLLCSDGITRHVSDDEIGRLLTTGMTPELICEHLKELCYERGAEDNLTAVVVKTLAPEFARASVPAVASHSAIPFSSAGEPEEETIATARSPFEQTAEQFESASGGDSDEIHIPTISDAGPQADDGEDAYLLEGEPIHEIAADVPDENETYSSSSVVVSAQQPVTEREFGIFGADAAASTGSVDARPSVAGRLLTSFLWLALGGILGVAGYYYWDRTNSVEPAPEPVPQLVQQSNDIQVSALEESRRLVDADPEAYLKSNSASPRDAADHYLLGRALLLSGSYFEAKRQFTIAKEKLNEADAKEVKTLAAEIAMANAIIGSGPATEAFKRDIALSKSAGTANSNTAPATNSNSDPATNAVP